MSIYVGPLPPVSNRAGWTFTRQIVDDDTDEAIDDSLIEAIVFEVRDPQDQRTVLSKTLSDGVTLLGGVFEVDFSRTDMMALEPRTYEVGCTVQVTGEEPQQFIIGTLPVLDGVVRR